MRIDWSNSALHELQEISEYIELDRGIKTANQVSQTIFEAVQELARLPNLGRQGRVEGTRELVVVPTPYIVVYRLIGGRILVLNIKHGAQRWP